MGLLVRPNQGSLSSILRTTVREALTEKLTGTSTINKSLLPQNLTFNCDSWAATAMFLDAVNIGGPVHGANGPLAAFTYDSCEEQGCAVPGFPASFNASFSQSPNGP